MLLRLKKISCPREDFPIIQILRIVFILICLLLKGNAPIRIGIYKQSDDPFNDIPYIEEWNSTQRPPLKFKSKHEGCYKDTHNSHLYLLSAMDVLMPLIYLVKVAFLPDKDKRPEAHCLVSLKGYEIILNYNHIGLF